MKAVVLWAAKNAFIAIMICLGIVAAGLYAAKELAIDAVPDLTNVQVQVVTRASALSATEVESQITQPIERGVAGVPGLRLTRSVSKLGISIVTLIFSDDIDVYFARQLVNERLVQIREQIPPAGEVAADQLKLFKVPCPDVGLVVPLLQDRLVERADERDLVGEGWGR